MWPALHGSLTRILTSVALLGLLASPINWENTLHAFQVQFYFLLGAALVHIAFAAISRAGSWRWWIGMSAGVFGLATMAASFLAPAAVIAVRALRAWRTRRWTNDDTITVVVCGALAGTGWALIHPMPPHKQFHARGITDFATALARILAFPFVGVPALALVMQAPLVVWIGGAFAGLACLSRPANGSCWASSGGRCCRRARWLTVGRISAARPFPVTSI